MKPKKSKQPANKLLDALKFIFCAQEATGAENETHSIISSYSISAFNGIIASGHPIDEDIEACPHSDTLIAALSRCGEKFAITLLSAERLCVRSGDFEAFVPCVLPKRLTAPIPDAAQAAVDDSLTAALRIVAPLVSDKAEFVATAAVQVRAGSVIATNLEVIIEAWHGLSLPTMLLPKAAVKAIVKCGKKPVSFGLSEKTATFWFEGGGWIKTQLYVTDYIDVESMLGIETSPVDIPAEFFEAVKDVTRFSQDGNVYCGNGYIRSHRISDKQSGGARYGVPIQGELAPRIYSAEALKLISKCAKTIDTSPENFSLFFGDRLRGAVAHQIYKELAPYNPYKCSVCGQPRTENICPVCGDDIPF